MSWGERSCKYINGNVCPTQATMEKCNVDCVYYESNGRTPDSSSQRGRSKVFQMPYDQKPDPETERKDKEIRGFIKLICKGITMSPRLRAQWDPAYRKEALKCLKVG